MSWYVCIFLLLSFSTIIWDSSVLQHAINSSFFFYWVEFHYIDSTFIYLFYQSSKLYWKMTSKEEITVVYLTKLSTITFSWQMNENYWADKALRGRHRFRKSRGPCCFLWMGAPCEPGPLRPAQREPRPARGCGSYSLNQEFELGRSHFFSWFLCSSFKDGGSNPLAKGILIFLQALPSRSLSVHLLENIGPLSSVRLEIKLLWKPL